MNGCAQVEIGSSARADLLAGYDFYESQRAGLGDYFTDSLLSDLEGLLIHAGVHVQVPGGLYRSLSSRFPYAIYYRLSSGTARVLAVLDTRQNPDRILKKLTTAV
jgi:plasmid stabilization system protein ParE